MTFAEYLGVLQKRWRIWVPILLVGILAAVAFNSFVPKTFTAVSTSFVTVAQTSTDGSGEIFQGSQFAVQRVKSYAPLASSPEVLQPVIDELRLGQSVRDLREVIEVSSPPETVLLQVAVSDPSAARAARMADAISRQMGSMIEELETPRIQGVSRVKVTLTQPADIPLVPSSPRTLLNLLLGTVAGMALGIIAALLRHQSDRRVKTAADVRAVTGMAPLGSTLASREAQHDPLVAVDYRSLAAEQYRTIRTALKFATANNKAQNQFVISSPMPGEGKTTVAANLAISWAQAGAQVCLVEADLRRPMVTRAFGLESSTGLSDVLVGAAKLDEVMLPWNNGMLTVLPAGSLPPDPAALLGSEAMTNLVAKLRSQFDVVIYDSPSILSVTDAVVLSRAADGLVLVVRAGSTTRDDLASSVDIVQEARLQLLGTVRSAVKPAGETSSLYYGPNSDVPRAELPYRWPISTVDEASNRWSWHVDAEHPRERSRKTASRRPRS